VSDFALDGIAAVRRPATLELKRDMMSTLPWFPTSPTPLTGASGAQARTPFCIASPTLGREWQMHLTQCDSSEIVVERTTSCTSTISASLLKVKPSTESGSELKGPLLSSKMKTHTVFDSHFKLVRAYNSVRDAARKFRAMKAKQTANSLRTHALQHGKHVERMSSLSPPSLTEIATQACKLRQKRRKLEKATRDVKAGKDEKTILLDARRKPNTWPQQPFINPLTHEPYKPDKFLNVFDDFPNGESPITEKMMRCAAVEGRKKFGTAEGLRSRIGAIREIAERKDISHAVDPRTFPIEGAENLVPSPVRVGVLGTLLKGCKATRTIKMLIEGFKSGFGLPVRWIPSKLGDGIVRIRPGKAEDLEKIKSDVMKEMDAHRIMMLTVMLQEFFMAPTFGRAKKGTTEVRRITNSSAPSPDLGLSLNDLLDEAWCRLDLTRLGKMLHMIERRGKDAIVIKIDIKDAYRLLPVRLEDLCFLTFACGENHFLDSRVTFGLRSAPRLFNVFADAIQYILQANGIESVMHYLDDFVAVVSMKSGLAQDAEILIKEVFAALNIKLSAKKCQCGTEVELLGFRVNTHTQKISLPDEKREELKALLNKALLADSLPLNELQSMAGKLLDASSVVKQGRSALHGFWKAIRERKQGGNNCVQIPSLLREDMKWWLRKIEEFKDGTSYRTRKEVTKLLHVAPPSSHASMTGMGGHYNGYAWQHMWTKEEKEVIRMPSDLQLAKATAVMITAWLFQESWNGFRVDFWCDDKSITRAITRGEAREDRTHAIVQVLADISLNGNFLLQPFHSICENNKPAYCLSKFFPIQEAYNSQEVIGDQPLMDTLRSFIVLPDPCQNPLCPSLIKALSQAHLDVVA
jgi:hypothetical protein